MPAKEIHVCGHECAVGLVQRLAGIMGEEFKVSCPLPFSPPAVYFTSVVQVKHYERLVPLVIQEKGLAANYRAVSRGDCVIVFSRKQVFETRKRIEAVTRQKCAVVYGNLPPGM